MSASSALRDVCIQDPRRHTAYFVTADELAQYRSGNLTGDASGDAVTFALTDEALIDTVEANAPTVSAEPDIVIRDLDSEVDYYLPFECLVRHEIERPSDHPVAKTYTIPMPEALVEEMPAAVRALLQTDFHTDGPNGERLRRDSK